MADIALTPATAATALNRDILRHVASFLTPTGLGGAWSIRCVTRHVCPVNAADQAARDRHLTAMRMRVAMTMYDGSPSGLYIVTRGTRRCATPSSLDELPDDKQAFFRERWRAWLLFRDEATACLAQRDNIPLLLSVYDRARRDDFGTLSTLENDDLAVFCWANEIAKQRDPSWDYPIGLTGVESIIGTALTSAAPGQPVDVQIGMPMVD
jgi:hypothetical protein